MDAKRQADKMVKVAPQHDYEPKVALEGNRPDYPETFVIRATDQMAFKVGHEGTLFIEANLPYTDPSTPMFTEEFANMVAGVAGVSAIDDMVDLVYYELRKAKLVHMLAAAAKTRP